MTKRLAGLRFESLSSDVSGGTFAVLDILCDGNHRDPGTLRITITDQRGRSQEIVVESPERDPGMEKVYRAILSLTVTIDNEHRAQPENRAFIPTEYR